MQISFRRRRDLLWCVATRERRKPTEQSIIIMAGAHFLLHPSSQQLGMHCVLLYYVYFYVIISGQVFWGQIDTRVTPWDSTEIIMVRALPEWSAAAPRPETILCSIKLASVDFSFSSRPPPAFSFKLTNHSTRLRCWRHTHTHSRLFWWRQLSWKFSSHKNLLCLRSHALRNDFFVQKSWKF